MTPSMIWADLAGEEEEEEEEERAGRVRVVHFQCPGIAGVFFFSARAMMGRRGEEGGIELMKLALLYVLTRAGLDAS